MNAPIRIGTFVLVSLVWIHNVQAVELTADEEIKYTEVFKHFDKDGSGSISIDELRDVMTEPGQQLNDEEIKTMFPFVDANGNGEIELKEFLDLMKTFKEQQGNKQDSENDYKYTFDFFDKDKSGTIDKGEYKEAMRKLGISASDDLLDRVFELEDTNRDGSLTFDEFKDTLNGKFSEKIKNMESEQEQQETQGATSGETQGQAENKAQEN